ncbi:phage protease [Gellertiella hungarica]|uniref:Phage I-like protein n=1 Tax=Gellertiella hungarica TaxID=1572859 RepID=A0A7W6J7Q1_9HYPH|nr:phage protease [Gellertiella hungarica]MBB4066267.1 phage I-like protein [Gellertiella hungarica]
MITKTPPLTLSTLAPDVHGIAEAMTGLTVLDAYIADPSAAARQHGPEWVKLAPRGKFTARDGRVFDVDPELLAARFEKDGVDLPIDIDHATVKKAMFGEAAPAVGWVSKLEARADGLYGKVEWLAAGIEVLAARTHRYISPTLKHDENGKAYWLHSAALVAAPAAAMAAVASSDLSTHEDPKMLKAIAAALGLSEDASEASCLSAVTNLKARVDPAVHQAALDQVKTLSAELEARNKADHQAKVDALLEDALKAKKIVPAQRDQYAALCGSPEGLAQVTALFATMTSTLNASGLDEKQPNDQMATLSAEDREVMKMLGISEEDYRKANGLTVAA